MRIPGGLAKMEVFAASEEDYIGTVVITDLRVSILPDRATLLATLSMSLIEIDCDNEFKWTATDGSSGSYTDGLGTYYLVGSGDNFLIKQ